MIETRIASKKWERIHRGVYRLAGTTLTWRQALMAACLACEPAVASHVSAAQLCDLRGFRSGPIELTVVSAGRRSRLFTVHRVRQLDQVDVTHIDGIPVTSPARTIIDLAAVAERDTVEEVLDDALSRKLISRARLRWRLEELSAKGRPGIAVIRSLLDAREPGASVPQSTFETRLLRLLKRARLPLPHLQHEVRDRGRLVAVVDFAYPDVKVAVEADGYRWHSGRLRWERDLARRNALTALGWRVIHVTWSDLTRRPASVIDAIRTAFSAQP